MKKTILNSILVACSLAISTQPLIAQTFDSACIFRSGIVYEPVSFPEAVDTDYMIASTVLTDIGDPNLYVVYNRSDNPEFIPTYISEYSSMGGGMSNFAIAYTIPPPGSDWEDYTYVFELVDSDTMSIYYDSADQYIPNGYVTDQLDTPDWYSFSGDLLNPTILWDETFSQDAGRYRIIVYELDPGGYTPYTSVYRSQNIGTAEFTLEDFTLVYGKSYDINIQSNLISNDCIQSRSNYHVRYDTANMVVAPKSNSNSNCIKINGRGILPITINGSEDFSVNELDVETLRFNGLQLHLKGNGDPLYSIGDPNQDGHPDLTCYFDDDLGNWIPRDGFATLTGTLLDGTPFEGTNSICVEPLN